MKEKWLIGTLTLALKEYAIWTDNPDKEGINKTEKALFMETITGA
jgi:hypothetical protein